MMKKLYYLTLICTLLTGMAFAQTNPTKNDPEAKKILDAVSAKFKTYTSVQASFTYKVENAAGKALSTKNGTILMKGTKYRLSFGGQEIFCNGTTVWNYEKGANEVTINTVDPAAGTITPQKLFSNFYDKDFYYTLNGEKKIGNKVVQEIQMTPVDKKKSFHTVYLQIDKASQSIYSTKVLENGGSRYSYTVTSMKTNVPAADNQFVFDKSKYPGVNVEDLR
jgi:outer membrane lipoprotein-sorting protein